MSIHPLTYLLSKQRFDEKPFTPKDDDEEVLSTALTASFVSKRSTRATTKTTAIPDSTFSCFSSSTTERDMPGPFEIIEIFEQIIDSLSPSDLAHCAAVCKSWSEPCLQRLWQRLDPVQFSHPSVIRSGHKFAHLIQHLHCSACASLSPLGGARKVKLHLRTLHPPHLTLDNSDQILSTLKRIKDTVQVLSLKFAHSGDEAMNIKVLQSLSQLKSLKELTLNNVRVPIDSYEHLLEQAPPGLESLTLEQCWTNWTFQANEATFIRQKRNRATAKTPTNNIKRLHIAGAQNNFETVLRVTRYSPLLESLTLSDEERPFFDVRGSPAARNESLNEFRKLLPVQCPRLRELIMVGLARIDVEGFKLLLGSVPNIRSFTTTQNESQTDFEKNQRLQPYQLFLFANLSTLGHLVGPKLESLTVESAGVLALISTEVLTMFPNLKHLKLRETGIHVDDSTAVRWACTELETLEMVAIGPNNWTPPESGSDWVKESKDKPSVGGDFVRRPGGKAYSLYEKFVNKVKNLPKLEKHFIEFYSFQ
ncbi:hypothetical protein BGZ83_006487 [Gryganskiella cystojenkinii]|nr:hypothetical protein BGZ83_006487 [Gryganskiella cystojenkinii]